jgi:hypothetical protein
LRQLKIRTSRRGSSTCKPFKTSTLAALQFFLPFSAAQASVNASGRTSALWGFLPGRDDAGRRQRDVSRFNPFRRGTSSRRSARLVHHCASTAMIWASRVLAMGRRSRPASRRVLLSALFAPFSAGPGLRGSLFNPRERAQAHP